MYIGKAKRGILEDERNVTHLKTFPGSQLGLCQPPSCQPFCLLSFDKKACVDRTTFSSTTAIIN